ncbi:MAG: hypothetical protein ACLFQR_05590 [Desulfovibrionales bacterium]
MLKQVFLPLAALACVLFAVLEAQAFMPPLQEIKKGLESEYSSLNSYQAEFRLRQDPLLSIRLWKEGPFWRQEWVEEDEETGSPRLLCASIGQGERLLLSYPEYRSVSKPVLWYWPPQGSSWMEHLSVDTSVSSYQFFKDRPALVYGATYGQLRRPQVWLDNERLVPLRLIRGDLELQWFEYVRVGNFWLPKVLGIVFPDAEPLNFDILWRRVNTPIPQEVFSRESFQQAYAPFQFSRDMPRIFRLLFERFPQAFDN